MLPDVTDTLRTLAARLQLDRPLCVLDLETTGTDPERDRIVEVAMVVVAPDGTTTRFESLVNPGMPIPPDASRVHGITDDDVVDAPTFRTLAPEISRRLTGVDLAGFGIVRFDLRMLAAELARAETPLDFEDHRVVDAMHVFFRREPRDLGAALRFYCGAEHAGHRAGADVHATIAVLAAQLERYPDLPSGMAALDGFCRPRDPNRLTSDGKIVWREGAARLAFGRHVGRSLDEMRASEPDYLEWMARADFAPDTRALVAEAIAGRVPTGPRGPR